MVIMKFSDEKEEAIYEIAVEDGGDGDVAAPTGWFAAVDTQDVPGVPAYYLVLENSDGIVTIRRFDSGDRRDEAHSRLERAYSLYVAEISDAEALEAISNYQVCARWSSADSDGQPLDSGKYADLEWSAAAQEKCIDDVVGFITENVEHIRPFLAESGLGWGQIGHDFWLTRNRHGAGFWDRGFAGPAVEALTESSHAWGEVSLYVTDADEIGAV